MNPLIRLLDIFLLAAFTLLLAACGGDDDDPTSEPTSIVDIASGNPNFEILVDLLVQTGLDESLDDPDESFTVFAPTDAAFEALGAETLSALADDPETLSAILQYHVLPAEVDSTAAIAAAGTTIATANGKRIAISMSGSSLLINTAEVTDPNNEADNGVIHVIDRVLMPPADMGSPAANIIETAEAAGSFTKLLAALDAADLTGTLEDETASYTVFAPTDAAFDSIGEANLTALLNDTDALEAILLQHVVVGAPAIDSISAYSANGTSISTASDAQIPVAITDGMLTLGGAKVSMVDIYTSNGIIHVLDTVIVGDVELPTPPMSIVDVAGETGSFDILISLLEQTGLDSALGDLESSFTVFAPTDSAFEALGQETLTNLQNDSSALTDILQYHVIIGSEILADAAIGVANAVESTVTMLNEDSIGLSYVDSKLFVNTATVTTPNVMADNGVIHVVDKVLLPPAEKESSINSIADIVAANTDFSTLLTALTTASLVSTLDNDAESFTLFAPTNSAFEAIPSETLTAILNDADLLNDLLLQHVVAGAAVDAVTAFTLNGSTASTAEGVELPVAIVDGTLQIGGATVTVYDVYASNGIIHVIDTVIVGDLTLP